MQYAASPPAVAMVRHMAMKAGAGASTPSCGSGDRRRRSSAGELGGMPTHHMTRGLSMGFATCRSCSAKFELGGAIRFECPSCRPKARPAGRGRPPGSSTPRPRPAAPTRKQTSRRSPKSMSSIVAKLDKGGRPLPLDRTRLARAGRELCRICQASEPMANADVCYSCNPE